MKPTRNRYFCAYNHRPKMLFKTRMKALNFIRFNREEFEDETKVPRRTYYCKACMGWHITSKPLNKPEWLCEYGN